MLEEFFSSNKDFCSSEFRNVKTSLSSRPSYGDDAISYVQLKREGKICPEHKVHAKLYAVTLAVDEDEEKVTSIQCHACVAAQGGCKQACHSTTYVGLSQKRGTILYCSTMLLAKIKTIQSWHYTEIYYSKGLVEW